MKTILLIVFFVGTFLQQIFAQDNRYEDYLKKNNLIVADTNIIYRDSINLLGQCKIRFSQNDSLIFADLITNDSIVQISVADLNNNPGRWIGRLYADFDSCFFWGVKISNNIHGNIIYKTHPCPWYKYDKYFIYIDDDATRGLLLLTDSEESVLVFNANNNTFTSYALQKEIFAEDLRYIRFVNIIGDTIILKNIDNNELLKGSKEKNNILN